MGPRRRPAHWAAPPLPGGAASTPSRFAAQRSYRPMATSAPAVAVRQPNAAAAQIEAPIEYNSMMVAIPHTTHAPERNAMRRTNPQPRAPARSARHISPDTPPTRDSTMTIQIGISTNACCSFVIMFDNSHAALKLVVLMSKCNHPKARRPYAVLAQT